MLSKLKYYLILLVLAIIAIQVQATESDYFVVYSQIKSMLSGNDSLDFKKAIFLTENAYFENKLEESLFDYYLWDYVSMCRDIINSGNINYPETDKEIATVQCAVFVFMTDTIPFLTEEGIVKHPPFSYNFDDFAGQKEWSNTFVTTLMLTGRGNCHSMPYLYKMIMDELGQGSYLSLAPNHIYIKAHNKRAGWHNVELTCGDFPTDAWLTASGYIHTDAIRNGIYMDTLSLKQSVAMCLVDLAQGYQAKFGIQDGSFILQCCETALTYFPNYINALLLKAETWTAIYKQFGENKELLAQMNDLYSEIHRLGYRKMPQNMYLNWLNSMGLQTTNYRMKSLLRNNNE